MPHPPPKHGVFHVEMRLLAVGDEKLRPVSVGAVVSHGNDSSGRVLHVGEKFRSIRITKQIKKQSTEKEHGYEKEIKEEEHAFMEKETREEYEWRKKTKNGV